MPNNFSSSKELTLKNGANLGEELMIVFDEEDIKKEREKLLPDLEKQKANWSNEDKTALKLKR